MSEVEIERRPLAVGSIGTLSNGYWGMVGLIVTEAALFVYLLFAYYYHVLQPHGEAGPPEGNPSLMFAIPQTAILVISSTAMWRADRGTRRRDRWEQFAGLAVTFLLGIAFIVLQWFEWANKDFTISSSTYGSLFFTTTGLHVLHAAVGVLILSAVMVWSLLGYFGPARNAPVTVAGIYWQFVVVLWLAIFFTFYITPRLGLQ
jgi:cytochrome c oxidase subunit III